MAACAPESDVIARSLDCLSMQDWSAAHALVQELESPLAYWVHGLVHKIEGDAPALPQSQARRGRSRLRSPKFASCFAPRGGRDLYGARSRWPMPQSLSAMEVKWRVRPK